MSLITSSSVNVVDFKYSRFNYSVLNDRRRRRVPSFVNRRNSLQYLRKVFPCGFGVKDPVDYEDIKNSFLLFPPNINDVLDVEERAVAYKSWMKNANPNIEIDDNEMVNINDVRGPCFFDFSEDIGELGQARKSVITLDIGVDQSTEFSTHSPKKELFGGYQVFVDSIESNKINNLAQASTVETNESFSETQAYDGISQIAVRITSRKEKRFRIPTPKTDHHHHDMMGDDALDGSVDAFPISSYDLEEPSEITYSDDEHLMLLDNDDQPDEIPDSKSVSRASSFTTNSRLHDKNAGEKIDAPVIAPLSVVPVELSTIFERSVVLESSERNLTPQKNSSLLTLNLSHEISQYLQDLLLDYDTAPAGYWESSVTVSSGLSFPNFISSVLWEFYKVFAEVIHLHVMLCSKNRAAFIQFLQENNIVDGDVLKSEQKKAQVQILQKLRKLHGSKAHLKLLGKTQQSYHYSTGTDAEIDELVPQVVSMQLEEGRSAKKLMQNFEVMSTIILENYRILYFNERTQSWMNVNRASIWEDARIVGMDYSAIQIKITTDSSKDSMLVSSLEAASLSPLLRDPTFRLISYAKLMITSRSIYLASLIKNMEITDDLGDEKTADHHQEVRNIKSVRVPSLHVMAGSLSEGSFGSSVVYQSRTGTRSGVTTAGSAVDVWKSLLEGGKPDESDVATAVTVERLIKDQGDMSLPNLKNSFSVSSIAPALSPGKSLDSKEVPKQLHILSVPWVSSKPVTRFKRPEKSPVHIVKVVKNGSLLNYSNSVPKNLSLDISISKRDLSLNQDKIEAMAKTLHSRLQRKK